MSRRFVAVVSCAIVAAIMAAVAFSGGGMAPGNREATVPATLCLLFCTSSSSTSSTTTATTTTASTTTVTSATTTIPAQSGRCNPPAPSPYPVNGDARGGPDEMIDPSGVDTCIGYYEDSSGQTALTTNNAAIEGPASNGYRANQGVSPSFLYFVGHDLNSIFRPFHNSQVGDLIYFWDAEWNAPMPHVYRITNIRRNVPFNSQPFPPMQGSAEALMIQACEDGTSSYDEIIDAVDN